MADKKLNKVYVRLTKDFPIGQTHRRAGLTLGAGPEPQLVELTDEQVAALRQDRFIEVVDKKEAEKWIAQKADSDKAANESTDAHTNPADAGAGAPVGGRNYETGANGGVDVDKLPGTGEEGDESGSADDANTPGTPSDEDEPEDLSTLKLAELKQIATDEGVAEDEVNGYKSKQAAIEGIEAHRANANANDGE